LLVDEMLVTEEAIAEARANGNQEELAALSQRLQALDQAAAREDDIASGQAKAREEEEKRVKKLQEETQKQGEKARDEYLKQQEKIFAEQRKAAEAEAKRQEERIRKLNTLGAQSVNVADIRNVESANLVLQLGAAAQDPALIQQRLQTKLLEKIALGIGQASSNYFNQPVAIVGYADVGGI
jgi:DNA anti-recombination protein RmuC